FDENRFSRRKGPAALGVDHRGVNPDVARNVGGRHGTPTLFVVPSLDFAEVVPALGDAKSGLRPLAHVFESPVGSGVVRQEPNEVAGGEFKERLHAVVPNWEHPSVRDLVLPAGGFL